MGDGSNHESILSVRPSDFVMFYETRHIPPTGWHVPEFLKSRRLVCVCVHACAYVCVCACVCVCVPIEGDLP